MSKRKDKENLPNEISSKKSKIERPTRIKPQNSTVQEVFLKKISTKIDSEPLTSSHLTEIVNTITRSSPLSKESNLLAVFKKIVNKNEFNSDMFLGLLDQLKSDFLSKYKNICAFFLSSLLMIHSEPSTFDQKACSSTAEEFKIFQFRPVHFTALIKHSFSLVRMFKFSNESRIYFKFFKIFISVNYSNQKYMKDKSLFTTAEKFLIQELSKRLELDKTGLISDEVLKAFKELIEKYPIECVDNNFLIKLYFSITNLMNNDKAEKMSVELLKFLSNIFEIELESKKSKMVQKCLIKSLDMKNLLFLFNINVLTTFVPQEVLNIKLMAFCYKILDQYGTPINKNFEEPKSVNESFCLFVSKIFKEVFMNTKMFREKLIENLLTKTKSNFDVHISQLEILLNSSNSIFLKINDQERSDIFKKLLYILCGSSRNSALLHNVEPSQAIKILKVFRKFFYLQAKKDSGKIAMNSLVTFLSSDSRNSNSSLREKSLLGLATLLAELNRNQFNSSGDVSHQSCIEANLPISLKIIEHLQKHLITFEKSPKIKSKIYQIMAGILKIFDDKSNHINLHHNQLLTSLGYFFYYLLEKYMTKNSDRAYFNLKKCFNMTNFKLTEPIDVLLHCADLYSSKALKLISSGIMGHRILGEIQNQIKLLKKFYLDSEPKVLFNIYKYQLLDKVKLQRSPAKYMKTIHQLIFGFIDVMLENSINTENYSDLTTILKRYESTSNLISSEIENLLSNVKKNQVEEEEESEKKRKIESSTTRDQKRSKKASGSSSSESIDKENESAAKTSSRNRREILQDVSNRPGATSTLNKPVKSNVFSLTFANLQFEHVHRISFACCKKMVQMYLGCHDESLFKNKDTISLGILTELLTNDTFVEFLIKVMETKLKSLKSEEDLYDPSDLSEEELFDFLSLLWVPLCQRVNGNLTRTKSVYKNIGQMYGIGFLNKYLRFIECLQLIWKICSKRFRSLRIELIKKERKCYTSSSYFECENRSKNSEFYWNFIENCLRTLKCLLNPTITTQLLSNKCSLALLNLTSDIVSDVDLKQKCYYNLSQFLYNLADNRVSADIDFGYSLVNFLAKISASSNTPVVLLKNLAMDYSSVRYLDFTDESESNKEPIDEKTAQFNFFNCSHSFIKYQHFINEKIINLFNHFKWCMSKLSSLDASALLLSLNSQIDSIVLTISYLLKAVFDAATAKVNFELMIHFYQFMTYYLKSDLIHNLNFDGLLVTKDLIDRISVFLQSNLTEQLNRINEVVIDEYQEDFDQKYQIIDIIRHKENMETLVNSIDEFEKELVNLNSAKNHEIKILDNYKTFVSSLKITIKSKAARFVSALEIDQILNDFNAD